MSLQSVTSWLEANAPDLRLIEVAASTATVDTDHDPSEAGVDGDGNEVFLGCRRLCPGGQRNLRNGGR